MSISKRERTLLIIVALLALFGAYYLLYLKPCTDDIKELNAEIETKELQVFANNQQKSKATQFQQDIDEINAQLKSYGENAAHQFDQPPVLEYLSKTVNDYGLKNVIAFSRTDQTGAIERYEIAITMITNYDGLKGLLSALEKAPYLLRISALEIDTGGERTLLNTDTAADTDEDTNSDTPADAGTDETADTVETTGTDTAATDGTQNITVDIASEKQVTVKMTLDFYCLSDEIPADTVYAFDNGRQFGGDIFY